MFTDPTPSTTLASGQHLIIYHLGVDGGGTGTRVRLAHADGRLLGDGHSGPSSLAQGVKQAWTQIRLAIDAAVGASNLAGLELPAPGNTSLGLGLAGANVSVLHQQFVQTNPGYRRLQLETDAYTSLLGAHGGRPGAMLAFGTGSVGLALHADGRRIGVGGWGFPSGDDGSGAVLGLRALNLAQRVLDGMVPACPLADAVIAATGISPQAVLDWSCSANQQRFATLAPLVFDCADRDPQAAALLDYSVHSMEDMARALDPGQVLPLAFLGSLGKRLATQMSAPIQQRMVSPQGDAMDGALALCQNA
jgi:glucosamine kinase